MPEVDVKAFDHVITQKGKAYLAKQQKGLVPKLTKAVVGSGFVDESDLENQTQVSDLIPNVNLEMDEREIIDDIVVKLPLRLMNTKLSKSLLMRQVGVYALDPDEGEILIQLLQYKYPQFIPSLEANRGATWVFNCDIDVFFANAEAAVIPASPGWFVSRKEFNAVLEMSELDVPSVGTKQHFKILRKIANWFTPQTDTHTPVEASLLTELGEAVQGAAQLENGDTTELLIVTQ